MIFIDYNDREDSDIDFEWSARVGFKVAISAFTGDGTFD